MTSEDRTAWRACRALIRAHVNDALWKVSLGVQPGTTTSRRDQPWLRRFCSAAKDQPASTETRRLQLQRSSPTPLLPRADGERKATQARYTPQKDRRERHGLTTDFASRVGRCHELASARTSCLKSATWSGSCQTRLVVFARETWLVVSS
jgi:hypothetical protein